MESCITHVLCLPSLSQIMCVKYSWLFMSCYEYATIISTVGIIMFCFVFLILYRYHDLIHILALISVFWCINEVGDF